MENREKELNKVRAALEKEDIVLAWNLVTGEFCMIHTNKVVKLNLDNAPDIFKMFEEKLGSDIKGETLEVGMILGSSYGVDKYIIDIKKSWGIYDESVIRAYYKSVR